jgi:hypothetical protein
MKFHVQFTYKAADREELLRFLHTEGLNSEGLVKLIGAWIAVQTGVGFAVIDSKDAKAVYDRCSRWSEYGQITVTPVIEAANV